jgi:hypothetical protein
LVPIARNKADNDVVIGNVVNNEAETAKNQAPNLEVVFSNTNGILAGGPHQLSIGD